MDRVEFGVRLPVAGPLASPPAFARVARESDAIGYDALWVHDFIVWTKHLDRVHISCGSAEAVEAAVDSPPNFFESLTTLAYVAALTHRARLGIAVLCLPFRQPVVAAKQVANIDVLSDGRLILGVGVGALKATGNQDFEVLGVPRGDKYERTRDYLRAMIEIWRSDQPSYEGRFVSFPQTEIYPKPVQRPHPPLWMGGAGPHAVELAGEFADGWLPGRIAIDEYPRLAESIRETARRCGRPDAAITLGSEIYACIAPTTEGARRDSARTIEALSARGGFATVEGQQAFAEHALIGSPADITAKIERYAAAGVRHFEMKFIYRTIDHLLEQLHLFKEEVVPAFRTEPAVKPGVR